MEAEQTRHKPQKNLLSPGQLFSESLRFFQRNLSVYLILYAISFVLALWDVLGRLQDNHSSETTWHSYLASAAIGGDSASSAFYKSAGGLLAILVIPYFVALILTEILNFRAAQSKTPTLGQLWNDFTDSWLWLKLIGVMVVSGLGIVLGFFALVVPGVILLWRWYLAPYIMIDKKVGVTEALGQSWKMTKGYGWPVYSALLFGFVLALTGIIPVVGSLIAAVLGAIYGIAPAIRYQEIKKTS